MLKASLNRARTALAGAADLAIAALAGLLAASLGARFEWHERLFDGSRRWEHLQLDEWPAALLAFALCLAALHARRQWQLRRALRENRRLARDLLALQEAERRRIARELHDELGQTLNAIRLDATFVAEAEGAAPALREAGQRMGAQADHAYAATRELLRRLRPVALDELGLAAALEACIDGWRRSHPQLAIRLSLGPGLDDLGETLDLSLYRLVQEAVTNCVRHAGARTLHIDLTRDSASEEVLLELHDDGCGIAPGTATRGGGLAGMRERVNLLGGHFALDPGPGRGLALRIVVPVAGPSS